MLIGLIDTGIDFDHPEFQRGTGHKIVALWDQLDTSRNNYHFGDDDYFGSVYYGDEINRRDCASRDIDGHGTMVASMAVGNTCGVAPGADLAIVKIDYYRFDEMVLAYAVDFIKKVAEERQEPYIISLSYLPKGGARDGETGVLARIVRDELQENLGGGLLKGIVAAAGNENYDSRNPCRDENNRMHIHRAGTSSFGLEIETSDEKSDDACIMEIWYPIEDLYSVSLLSPSGNLYGPIASDQASVRAVGEDGFVVLSNSRKGLEKWGAIRVVLRDPDSLQTTRPGVSDLRPGRWSVQMDGESGVWHAYITYVNPDDVIKAIDKDEHTNDFKVRSAGNVDGVIAVGSIDSDVFEWQNLLGGLSDYTLCYVPNEISHFSSHGPSKVGVEKPDLYAPGAWVQVAVSQDLQRDLIDSELRLKTIASEFQYVMNEGTSFAAPQVAGAVAAMIQSDSDNSLTHDRIKYILREGAKKRGEGKSSYFCLDIKKALSLSARY